MSRFRSMWISCWMILTWILLAAVVILFTTRTILFTLYAYYQIFSPFEAYHLEAKMIYMSWCVQQGHELYPNWHTPPSYEANFFGPIYFLVAGCIGRYLSADLNGLYLIGRIITVVASLSAAFLVGVVMMRRHGPGSAMTGFLGGLGAAPMAGFSVMARPDALADTLGFAGFLASISDRLPRKAQIILGSALLALSVLTKQTAGVYAVACLLALGLEGQWRKAFLIMILAITLVLATLTIGSLAVEPRLIADFFGEATTPPSLPDWRTNLSRLILLSPEVPFLCLVGLGLWINPRNHSAAFWALNISTCVLTLIASIKLGADLNYFLAPRLVAALALGEIWHAVIIQRVALRKSSQPDRKDVSPRRRRFSMLIQPILLLSILITGYHSLSHMAVQSRMAYEYSRANSTLLRSSASYYRKLYDLAGDPEFQLLTDSGNIALRQGGRSPFVDPWLFRMLVETGRIDPSGLENRIRKKEFNLILTLHDLFDPTYDEYSFGFPPRVAAVVRQHYRKSDSTGSIFVYVPRDTP